MRQTCRFSLHSPLDLTQHCTAAVLIHSHAFGPSHVGSLHLQSPPRDIKELNAPEIIPNPMSPPS